MADRFNSQRNGDRAATAARRRDWLLRAARGSAAALLICLPSGCAGVSNAWRTNTVMEDFVIGHRNRALSARAWHAHKHHFCDRQHLSDFCAGFRAGYEGVADGGDGCVPSMAPRPYWGWRYQSPEGQAKVSSWFAGYPMGVKAAEEDGIGHWSQIQTLYPASVGPGGTHPGAIETLDPHGPHGPFGPPGMMPYPGPGIQPPIEGIPAPTAEPASVELPSRELPTAPASLSDRDSDADQAALPFGHSLRW